MNSVAETIGIPTASMMSRMIGIPTCTQTMISRMAKRIGIIKMTTTANPAEHIATLSGSTTIGIPAMSAKTTDGRVSATGSSQIAISTGSVANRGPAKARCSNSWWTALGPRLPWTRGIPERSFSAIFSGSPGLRCRTALKACSVPSFNKPFVRPSRPTLRFRNAHVCLPSAQGFPYELVGRGV
ncbi:hypothetical protein VTI74DRAFT_6050 [Chaetomium olivicolor]